MTKGQPFDPKKRYYDPRQTPTGRMMHGPQTLTGAQMNKLYARAMAARKKATEAARRGR